jgi:ABC-type lipoprotein export system ATPase subunit
MTAPREPTVQAHDLFCLYPTPTGHVAALRGLSLSVAAGERVVVHGPNGSGKTTLLRVLAGEQPPSAGIAVVAGVDLAGADEGELTQLRSRLLGLVDQQQARSLRPELDVAGNVALQLRLAGVPAPSAADRARAALGELGLEDLAERRPPTLSGGEAQRVAVCAAVAHRPVVLLADEPTGELDRDSAHAVYALLARAADLTDASLLLVTHDVRAAEVADRVVRIRDGRLSEEWEPAPGDAAPAETLVVDDRGWVRLPERLRRDARVDGGVRARVDAERIVLTGSARTWGGHAGSSAGGVGAGGFGAGAAGAGSAPGAAPVPPPGSDVTAVGTPACLRGVRVARGERVVLDGVDVDVRPAAVTVVQGPSGSGKTTLLRVLAGLDRPDAGEVTVGGRPLAGLDRDGLAALRRAHVAVAGQGGGLVDALDVEENLALARDARGLPADRAAVDGWIDRLGLHGLRARRVGVLSGGERQRALVARVLVSGAGLAVLDEPTSQQDEANAERVVAALRAAAEAGTAVVVATHDPVLVAAADHVVALG